MPTNRSIILDVWISFALNVVKHYGEIISLRQVRFCHRAGAYAVPPSDRPESIQKIDSHFGFGPRVPSSMRLVCASQRLSQRLSTSLRRLTVLKQLFFRCCIAQKAPIRSVGYSLPRPSTAHLVLSVGRCDFQGSLSPDPHRLGPETQWRQIPQDRHRNPLNTLNQTI